MVASGASGTDNAGGLNGYVEYFVIENYESNIGVKATQTSGYKFGIGGNGEAAPSEYCNGQAGGGGGYYGGGGANASGVQCYLHSASSGSSYISGHTGCVAITSEENETPKSGCETGTTNNSCSIHYSGKTFANTVMIDGYGQTWSTVVGDIVSYPNPLGGFYVLNNKIGRVDNLDEFSGNGYARITLLSLD